jgi:hypothetical protein
MTQEKWEDTISKIKDQFQVLESDVHEEDHERREWIIFEGPIGRLKLERIVTPKVVGQKVIGSRRIGGQSHEEWIYSEDELIDRIHVSKWSDASESWEAFRGGDQLFS